MIPAQHVFEDADPFGSSGVFPGDSQGPVHSTPAPAHSTPAPDHSTPAPAHSTPAPPTLTEEQRRRIELNKQLALERRLARLRQHTGEGATKMHPCRGSICVAGHYCATDTDMSPL